MLRCVKWLLSRFHRVCDDKINQFLKCKESILEVVSLSLGDDQFRAATEFARTLFDGAMDCDERRVRFGERV